MKPLSELRAKDRGTIVSVFEEDPKLIPDVSVKVEEIAPFGGPLIVIVQCPLCGFKFDKDDNKNCSACPHFMKCGLILCPNCGHEFS